MPELNYATGWQGFGQGMQNFGNSLNNIAVGLAQQQYQRQMAAQQLALKIQELDLQRQMTTAHVGLFGAEAAQKSADADYLKKKADDLTSEAGARTNLGNAFAEQVRLQGLGDTYGDQAPMDVSGRMNQATQDIVRNLAQLPDKDRQHLLANVFQARMANDPTAVRQIGLGNTEMYHNVPAGAAAFPMMPGMQQLNAPYTLGPEQQRYAGGPAPIPPSPVSAAAQSLTTPQPGSPDFAAAPIAVNNMVRPNADTPENRMAGRNIELIRAMTEYGGLFPGKGTPPESPFYPIQQSAIADLNDFYAKRAAARSTNAPAPAPASAKPSGEKFSSVDAAKQAGKKSGDVISLFDPVSNRYRPFRLD